MPVENEFNYVLDDPRGDLRGRLATIPGVKVDEIVQAYLNEDSRIRSLTLPGSDVASYVFTFKRKVNGKVREIETPMSKDDFDALLTTAERTLTKTRYSFEVDGVHWDVDYFRGRKGVYFVKAEAEVGQDVAIAPRPCAALEGHVLYEAGKQRGFSSRRLCDESYARDLMRVVRDHAKRRESRLAKSARIEETISLRGLAA